MRALTGTVVAALFVAPTPLGAQHVIVVPPSPHAPPAGSAPPPPSSPRTNPVIQSPAPQVNPEVPTPAPQQQPDQRTQNPVESACAPDALGVVPEGTRILDTSIVYTHSVQSGPDPVRFYQVTVSAEQDGRRFRFRYECREWGSQIRIKPLD